MNKDQVKGTVDELVGTTKREAGHLTGNTELQAELLLKLRPIAFLGSTVHFAKLVEILQASGQNLPADWNLKHAFLGREFGDWTAQRRDIEQRFALKTWSCYGAADLGWSATKSTILPVISFNRIVMSKSAIR